MALHAKLSASGSHRWLYCPGSVKAESALPNTTSIYAQEGTAAHELAELALNGCGNAFSWVGKALPDNNAFTVTEEMAESVQVYIDYVRSFEGEHAYEQRVDFSDWVPEGFGTADAVVIQDDTIRVIDLKMGRGLRVDAEGNTQGILYALGAYAENQLFHDFKRVVVTIVQPRLDHIDEWELSIGQLLKSGEWISQRANEALQEDAERKPGESQCNWCKAKASCPALKQHVERIIMSDFDSMEAPSIDSITPTQMRQALDNKKLVIGWLDAIEDHVKATIEKGESFDGYKLVAGRSARAWADDGEAERVLQDALGEAAHERKLLSVAKAEKVLGKAKRDLIADMVIKTSGKPTLVPSDDKRPSISIDEDDFNCFGK